MTPGLSDPAEIAEVELLGGIPQHDGVLRYRFLTRAQSLQGDHAQREVERGWKWAEGHPRPIGINPEFIVYFPINMPHYLLGERGCPSP